MNLNSNESNRYKRLQQPKQSQQSMKFQPQLSKSSDIL